MSQQSDSDFIEQEARQEYVRQQTLLHIMQQQAVLVAALNQTCVLKDEVELFAATYESYAQQLRKKALGMCPMPY
jgi:hypothetical protein